MSLSRRNSVMSNGSIRSVASNATTSTIAPTPLPRSRASSVSSEVPMRLRRTRSRPNPQRKSPFSPQNFAFPSSRKPDLRVRSKDNETAFGNRTFEQALADLQRDVDERVGERREYNRLSKLYNFGKIPNDLSISVPSTSAFDLSFVISDITRIFKSIIQNPYFVVISLVVLAIIIASGPSATSGPLGNMVSNSRTSNNTIGLWISDNPQKFYGLLVFAPSIYTLPAKYKTLAAFLAFAWVTLVPTYTIWEYIIQSGALFIYFRTASTNTRTFVVFCAIMAYYIGYITFKP